MGLPSNKYSKLCELALLLIPNFSVIQVQICCHYVSINPCLCSCRNYNVPTVHSYKLNQSQVHVANTYRMYISYL